MKLKDYERTKSTRGMHGWGNLYGGYSDRDLDLFRDMKLGWVKILDDGGGNHLDTGRRLRERGIMPIIRLFRGQQYPDSALPAHFFDTVRRYVEEGITRWFEIGNEPNLDGEWKDNKYPGWQAAVPIVAPLWLADAERVIEAGGYPALPALAPCAHDNADQGRHHRVHPSGPHCSICFYQAMFEWLAEHEYERAKAVFENGVWFAVHPYFANHWYKDEEGKWHFEYPDDPICQADDPGRSVWDDDVGLIADGKLCNELLKQHFGLGPLPAIGTEGGPGLGGDNRYPEYSDQQIIEGIIAMFDWMATDGPDWMFGLCLWLWDVYKPGDISWPASQRMMDTIPRLKELPEVEEGEEEKEEVKLGAYRSHYVLFPQGVSWEWYEAASRYLMHYRVTNGQSHDDAMVVHGALGHTITAINPSDDVLEVLRQGNFGLDIIRADTPQELKAILDWRVDNNRRFG